jgi:hypothetical protein
MGNLLPGGSDIGASVGNMDAMAQIMANHGKSWQIMANQQSEIR